MLYDFGICKHIKDIARTVSKEINFPELCDYSIEELEHPIRAAAESYRPGVMYYGDWIHAFMAGWYSALNRDLISLRRLLHNKVGPSTDSND